MQYRYGAKEQFDATKQSLNKPAAGASPNPRPLLDAMNYGASFPGFRSKVKFRSKQGSNLRTGVAPLYVGGQPLRDPRHAGETGLAPDDDSDLQSDEREFSAATPAYPFPTDAPPVPVAKPKISTPMAAGLAGIVVAIAVGVGIANSNSFQLKPAGIASEDPIASENAIATEPAATATVDRAALAAGAATLPAQSKISPAASLGQANNARAGTSTAGAGSSGASPAESTASSAANMPSPAPAAQAAVAVATPPVATSKPKKPVKQASNTTRASDAPNSARQARKSASSGASTPAPKKSSPPSKPYSDREPAYTADARSSTRARYEQCEQVSGLFRREQCKWRVCGDRWGHDGCPAYKQPKINPVLGAMLADERGQPLRLENLYLSDRLNQA